MNKFFKEDKTEKIQSDDNFPDDNYKNQIVQQSPKLRFYRFNEEIGSGSYKSVYRGYDSDTGKEIAWNIIKLIRLPIQQRKRIIQQIAILKNIHHNKIINFINAWINKNQNEMIFITEMVCGGSLKKHLRRIRKPRLKIIKGWCKEILQGLNYLHTIKPNPIIHRDIKCQNIFINTNTNQIRIGDLGLAISAKNSYAQTLIGTPQFMAPQILEGKYSTKVDIYAFGMTILQMVTHQIPYRQCKNIHQIYKNIQQRIKPKCIDLIESEILRKFIEKCLDQQSKRPSAQELLDDEFFVQHQDDNKQVKLKQAVLLCDSLDYSIQTQKELRKNQQQSATQIINNHRPNLSYKHMSSMQVMLNQGEKKQISQQNNLIKQNSLQKKFIGDIKKSIQQDFRHFYMNFSSKYKKNHRKQFISTKDFYELQLKIIKQYENEQLQEQNRIKKQINKNRKQHSVQHTNKKLCKTNSSKSSELSKKKKRQNQNIAKNNTKSKYTQLNFQPQKVFENEKKNSQQLQTKSLISNQMNDLNLRLFKQQSASNMMQGNKITFEFKNAFKSNRDVNIQQTKNKQRDEKNLLNCKTQNKLKNLPMLQIQSKYLVTNDTTKKAYESLNNSQLDSSSQNKNKLNATIRLYNSSNSKQINSLNLNQSINYKNQKKQDKCQQQNKNLIKQNKFLTESALSKRSDTNPCNIKNNLKNSKKQNDLSTYQQFNKVNFLAKIKKDLPKFPISKDKFIKQDVILIQNIISKIMDEKVEIAGVYGFYTEQLVKKFQRKHNLTVNGIIDSNVYSMMIEQLQKKLNVNDKQKQSNEKSQEIEKLKKKKNQESNILLTELQNEILKRQNSH